MTHTTAIICLLATLTTTVTMAPGWTKCERVVAKMPSWLQHVSGHLFLHQDLVFLHHQV